MNIQDIQKARENIASIIRPTPVLRVEDDQLGKSIALKLENTHPTGAFKERGACNKLQSLENHKIVATSAGNHSQAVSRHGKLLGQEVHITMPKSTAITKILATERWGAKVHLVGDSFHEALVAGKQMAEELGADFIHAFDDPLIIAGQGTVGLELLEQVENLDTVVIPVGGGGLASGVALAIKENNPHCRVIGVQAEVCDVVRRVYLGETVSEEQKRSLVFTLGDGIAIKTIGEFTIPIMQKYLDDIVTVSEEEMAEAVLHLLQSAKILSEGGGAAGYAALRSGKIKTTQNTATIISGGNVDMTMLSKMFKRKLRREGRVANIKVKISDQPGSLARLTKLIAETGVSVLQIHHERALENISFFETTVDLRLEFRGQEHFEKLYEALTKEDYECKVEKF